MRFDDQLSGFVESCVCAVGPLDASDNSWYENANGAARLVTPFNICLHRNHTGLCKTVALENCGLREESRELLESFVGERSGTAHDYAKTGKVEFPSFVALAEHDSNWWDKEEVGDLVFDNALEYGREAELGHDYKRAAAVQLEEEVVEHSVDV